MPPGILATDAYGNIIYSSSFSAPPFPVQFLKGRPVFWDDFESGPAGFIMPERGTLTTTNTGPRSISSGAWNFRDGNEYGVYITADAAATGKRSLFTGGDPTTRTYGDVGNQDVSVDVPVTSGIIGVEFSLLVKSAVGNNGHLLSIENHNPNYTVDVTGATGFREIQLTIVPANTSGGPFLQILGSGLGTTTVLSHVVLDSHGNLLARNPSFTGPFQSGTTTFTRGGTGAWHRVAFIVDQYAGLAKYLFIDNFFCNLQEPRYNIPVANYSGGNAIGLREGLFRIEFHSLTNGEAFAPEIYHDNIVVTDELGQKYS